MRKSRKTHSWEAGPKSQAIRAISRLSVLRHTNWISTISTSSWKQSLERFPRARSRSPMTRLPNTIGWSSRSRSNVGGLAHARRTSSRYPAKKAESSWLRSSMWPVFATAWARHIRSAHRQTWTGCFSSTCNSGSATKRTHWQLATRCKLIALSSHWNAHSKQTITSITRTAFIKSNPCRRICAR